MPRHRENAHDLLEELGKDVRGSTLKIELRSIRDSLAGMQRLVAAVRKTTDGKLEGIRSELETRG
jgi:hypothetical protein